MTGDPHQTTDWHPIETAPRDGTTIRYRRVLDGEVLFQGDAKWGKVHFPAFADRYGFVPGEDFEGWLTLAGNKRVPEPSHWLAAQERPHGT